MLLRQYLAALLLCAAGCGDPESGSFGLLVEQPRLDLGEVLEGTDQLVEFGFEVGGAEVIVYDIESSCGCLNARLLSADGQELALGQALPLHSRGSVRATWKTAGYSGARESTLKLLGTGPGMPMTLRFTGDLASWYQVEPRPVTFEAASRDQGGRVRVTVRADQPFRLLDRLALTQPLVVEGIPSEQAAREQHFEIVLPADSAEEGEHRGFVQIRTDQELPVVVPVIFTVASEIVIQPVGRFLAGGIHLGQADSSVLEVRSRVGTLADVTARWEGPPGVQIHVVTLEEQRRYQLQLVFAEDLALGPLRGTIHISMAHRSDGRQQRVDRAVPFVGVVN